MLNNARVRDRLDGDGLLDQAEEELPAVPRRAPVEAERELVQLVVQVRSTHGALVSPEQPSLEQGDNPVHPRQQFRREFVLAQQPTEGTRATHQSEIRFLYDEQYLYVGDILHEDEPTKLLINELKRDFNARDGDLLVVAFDTCHDKLNSYDLQINPGCALRDSQSYDDGWTVNANWDAVWFCRSSIVADGWNVEMFIPFKQPQFPKTDEQVWGLQVFRLVRHNNEQMI